MTDELGGRAKITLQPAPGGRVEAKLRYHDNLLIASGEDATAAVGVLHSKMQQVDAERGGDSS